ncbi:reverse transcriptase-rnase h-integrase [Moniliophthora roreri]|nr:reverse transcriptase-rnase h-integrase [Moniliophthora roreri]
MTTQTSRWSHGSKSCENTEEKIAGTPIPSHSLAHFWVEIHAVRGDGEELAIAKMRADSSVFRSLGVQASTEAFIPELTRKA